MRRPAAALALPVLVLLVACGEAPPPEPTLPSPAFDDAFWKAWGDGRADLAGYALTIPRYGAPREGTAVAIWVTETFSEEDRVKAEGNNHPEEDTYPVMKLNLVQDFPTGIYDYNLMTSAWTTLAPRHGAPAGSATKVSFSAQEWCGQVYAQLLFDPRSIRHALHSYFDGESDLERSIPIPAPGISEDALWTWARGLAWPALAPGEVADLPVLISLRHARTAHRGVEWGPGRLARAEGTTVLEVPAGRFDVETLTAELPEGRTWTFKVEAAAPRRLVAWESNEGEKAVLLGWDRSAYWTMNRPGFEESVRRLGLSPRPPRTP